MAIFGIGKKKEDAQEKTAKTKAVKVVNADTKAATKAEKAPKAVKTATTVAAPSFASSATESIIKPHITEKAGLLSQGGVYTFQVSESATKQTVAKAIKELYKVTPVRVAMINLPSKQVFVRGRRGTVSGIRKAVVTVKKGEKIDFV